MSVRRGVLVGVLCSSVVAGTFGLAPLPPKAEAAQVDAAPAVSAAERGKRAAVVPQQLRLPRAARLGVSSTAGSTVEGRPAPRGKALRVRELVGRRSATSKSFVMSDGSTQVEVSTTPVHYRDGQGRWQPVDATVVAGRGERFVNRGTGFTTRFGAGAGSLVRVERDGRAVELGLPEVAAGSGVPESMASGSSVTYRDVFGTADVRYTVHAQGVKEDILLASPAEVAREYRLELSTGGLVPRSMPDGSIGLFDPASVRGSASVPVVVSPAPFMFDSSERNGAGGPGWSDRVRQSVQTVGGRTFVVLEPDQAWLRSPERVWPVNLDPSLVFAPDPGAAQDTSINAANPNATGLYGGSSLPVGGSSGSTVWRGLVKFELPPGLGSATRIRSADLNLHFASPNGPDSAITKLSAYPVTKDWSEATASWSSMASAYDAAGVPFNEVVTDDQDELSTSFEGAWEGQVDAAAVGGAEMVGKSVGTADAFVWDARLPGSGSYAVDAFLTPTSAGGSPTYTVTGAAGGAGSKVVNQATVTAPGQWVSLATGVAGAPGADARVRMVPAAGTSPVADAVRWRELGTQTRKAGDWDQWHSYAVGSLVQDWVSGVRANHGFLLRADDESVAGGVWYQASEPFYNDVNTRPTLVVTFDEPGVGLNPPAVVHSTGAELTWSAYEDPSPAPGDDLVEYQIFRGCTVLPQASGGCPVPVSEQFEPAYVPNPQATYELVGSVPGDVTAFTDTTAVASASGSDPARYVYWVVARTVDDVQDTSGGEGGGGRRGRAASNGQAVTIPRTGHVVRAFTGNIADSTLLSAHPDAVAPRVEAGTPNTKYWLQVGNSHSFYGDERAVLEFDTASIKTATRVVDARLELFASGSVITSGTPGAVFDLHGLSKDFVEDQVTWNKASSTSAWSTPGGDFDPAVLASLTASTQTQRLTFAGSGLTQRVQSWVDSGGNNHGVLLKTRDEAAAQQYLNLINSESPDSLFHPRLVVEHLAKNDAQTIEADQIPQRFAPNTTITTPVTVTNTTTSAWPANLFLSYRWSEPGSGEDLSVTSERKSVALGKALAPGESVNLVLPVRVAINSTGGANAARLEYDLTLDLALGQPSSNVTWFSTTTPLATNTVRPLQGCAMIRTGLLCVDRHVEEPTSAMLGLEDYLSYSGTSTGAGSGLLSNLYTGNTVWSYDPISNPSVGPSSFVRLTYNGKDTSDTGAGYGFSVQPGTLTRLGPGKALSTPSSAGGSAPKLMSFIDGDGTTHTYKLVEATATATVVEYRRPGGVALALTWNRSAPAAQQWVFTRADGTRFFFDQDSGRPVTVVDRNQNTLTYTYDGAGRLTGLVDAKGRTTLTLRYVGTSTNLTSISDHSGRTLKFTYNASHQLTKLEDGGPFDTATGTYQAEAKVKSFGFAYTATSTNGNALLTTVTDPMGSVATVSYFTSTENSAYADFPKQVTDRRGSHVTFGYQVPASGADAKELAATVTAVNGATPSVTRYRMDAFGRTVGVIDPNTQAAGNTAETLLGWDSDHNVIRLQELNGAVSTWRYDPVTGYPVVIRDAEAVRTGHPGTTFTYQQLSGAPGAPTVLTGKDANHKDAQGRARASTFGYDQGTGDLLTVRNGLGHGPTYTYNSDGTLASAKDARGAVTTYAGYDPNGYPQTITDPTPAATKFVYDPRGNVLQVTNPLNEVITAEYDAFSRPTRLSSPHEGSSVRTTVTEYDLNDRVSVLTAPNGAVSTMKYDGGDLPTERTLPANSTDAAAPARRELFAYDPLGRLTVQTAPKGAVTTSDPDDFVTRYGYDRNGQVTKVETPFVENGTPKTPTTLFSYDAVGNQILVVDPNKFTTPGTDYTAKAEYDHNHRVVTSIDAGGYASRTEYDPTGLVTATIDQLGHRVRTVYDAAGQPVTVTTAHTPTGATRSVDRVTKNTYDPGGNLTRVERVGGAFSETDYDANNRPIQTRGAFKAGDANYANPSRTFSEYDTAGRLTGQSDPTFATTKAGAAHWTRFTHHPSGQVKTSTDPWGIATSYGHDQLGNQTSRTVTAATESPARAQSWSYYPDGSLATRADTAAGQPVTAWDSHIAAEFTTTGTWATVTGGTNTQGGSYRTHAAASGSTDTATWHVNAAVAGQYEVFASCPVRTDTTTAAPYTITHAGGTTSKTINQKACTAATPWVSLGTYTYTAGAAGPVVLKPSATGVVAADAVKLVSRTVPGRQDYSYAYDLNGARTHVNDTTTETTVDTYVSAYDGLGRLSQVQELLAGAEKRRTGYGYDLAGQVLTVDAARRADATSVGTSQHSSYSWDVRGLLATAKVGPTAASVDTWTYRYDPRGLRSQVTKPNGAITAFAYHEDRLLRSAIEKTADGKETLSSHLLKYTMDGDRSSDVEKVDLQSGITSHLDQTSTFAYTPDRRLASVTRTGQEKGENESYTYDAAGNITKQTIGAATTTMTYDRNRLVTSVVGSTTFNHRYDAYGRASLVDVQGANRVVERYGYDGWDRLIRHQKWNSAGVHQATKESRFDALDRTIWQSLKPGAATAATQTRFNYLGMAEQVASEEQLPSGATWKTTKAYALGPAGDRLALTDTPLDGSPVKKRFYGYNPHGDVEMLTDATGKVAATYRYTAYGQIDKVGTTGEDAPANPPDPVQDADQVNPYRFNAKRFDGATATIDMGFRDYNPGLNRFLTRDTYNGAFDDLALGTDPWMRNRYAYAGGNPISFTEYDGHRIIVTEGAETAEQRAYSYALANEAAREGTYYGTQTQSQPNTGASARSLPNYLTGAQSGQSRSAGDGYPAACTPECGVSNTSRPLTTAEKVGLVVAGAVVVGAGIFFLCTGTAGVGCLAVGAGLADGAAGAGGSLAAGTAIVSVGARAATSARSGAAANGVPPRFITTGAGTTIDRLAINTSISAQRQGRHVLGARQYGGGSYFNSVDDAQRVLDDFHSGSAQVLGVKGNDIVVRAPNVTGFNHNPGAGFPNQATNVFFIKGSSSPSVVPYNPAWTP